MYPNNETKTAQGIAGTLLGNQQDPLPCLLHQDQLFHIIPNATSLAVLILRDLSMDCLAEPRQVNKSPWMATQEEANATKTGYCFKRLLQGNKQLSLS